jgi:glycosyltransferase involved in cell wall biosynthesis
LKSSSGQARQEERTQVVNTVDASLCTVSVIVPTRDRLQWLGEALGSIGEVSRRLGQRATIETIIVDDGSDPATQERAVTFGAHYVRNEGRGVGAARNTGLRAATGTFVTFLDDDDAFTEDHIAVQLDRFDADPGLGAVFGQSIEGDAELRPFGTPSPAQPLPDGDALSFFSGQVIPVGTLLVRRSAMEDAGLFDEHLVSSEDWDWELRLASATRVVGVPVVVYRIRRHRDPWDLDMDSWWARRRHDDVVTERAYRYTRPRLPLASRLLWRLKAHKINGADTAVVLSWALSCQERGIAHRAAAWMAAAWYISPLHTLMLVGRHRALVPIFACAVRGGLVPAQQPTGG